MTTPAPCVDSLGRFCESNESGGTVVGPEGARDRASWALFKREDERLLPAWRFVGVSRTEVDEP